MTFSTTEVFGFAESFIEFARNSDAELTALGLNINAWLAELEDKKKTAVTLNDEQEKMKAAMKDLTARTQQSIRILYDLSSTRLDAVIGSVGKRTELGKQAAKLRSKVRIQRKEKAEKAG